MKKLILISLLFLNLVASGQLTGRDKYQVKQMVRKATLQTLTAADPKAPKDRPAVTDYYVAQIDACTNKTQIMAISNSIAAHQ